MFPIVASEELSEAQPTTGSLAKALGLKINWMKTEEVIMNDKGVQKS